jgi:hypothetical protein
MPDENSESSGEVRNTIRISEETRDAIRRAVRRTLSQIESGDEEHEEDVDSYHGDFYDESGEETHHPSIPARTGFDLEGRGVQVNHNVVYPGEVPVNDNLEFREETIEVMTKWRRKIKPFRPKEWSIANLHSKIKKFQWLVDVLSDIYEIPSPRINIGHFSEQSWNSPGSNGNSCYDRSNHSITLHGKPSITTLLHEFGHARGFDEMDASIWSVNLFRKIFPKSYGRLIHRGHVLLQEARVGVSK